MKKKLAGLLPELMFHKTVCDQLVELNWHLWDLKADWPEVPPDSGKPGDCPREWPASAALHQIMEPMWECGLPVRRCDVNLTGHDPAVGRNRYRLGARHDCCEGLFHSNEREVCIIADEAAKRILEGAVGEWASFIPLDK